MCAVGTASVNLKIDGMFRKIDWLEIKIKTIANTWNVKSFFSNRKYMQIKYYRKLELKNICKFLI